MEKERILFLDILRLLACCMVIAMHAPMPAPGVNGMFLSSLSYFTAPCIGLFFMVSGSLLLPVSEHEDTFTFIKRRLTKVLGPTLFWTAFYLVVYAGFSVRTICSVPFSAQGHGILWFMYTLTGLYLIAPIVSAWLRHSSEKELRFYLLLWGVSLCYPLLENGVRINTSETGVLYYLSGYAGYFVLGYYLKQYGDRLKLKYVTLLFLLSACAPVCVKLGGYEVDFYRVFWYLSIFVVLMCLFWWKLIEKSCARIVFPKALTRYIILISNLSFGIYLSHIFIMRDVLWKLGAIATLDSYYLQTLVVFVLTFVLSFLLSWIIALLPKSQYLIGYHAKR